MASASADHPTPVAAVRPAKPDVTLRAATHDDVPILASIADAAFQTDTHTQLKAAFHGADNFAEGMKQALGAWVDHPKVDVVVAEDSERGRLVGWAGWVRRGFAGDTDLPLDGPSEEPTAETHLAGKEKRTIKDLEDLTNASMGYWVQRFMPEGSRCRFLCSYVVHPEFQSRGVGSRLMKWGTDKADAEPGVYCWVQSSMGGKTAFERQGFREIGRLEAALDDFAEGKMPGEENEHITGSKDTWGTYAWVYMRRDARG
ncbi:GNAT family acetyltransferase [Colletotrichum tofieldiae]|uniref:GNAT family acetyltransferase n=1 Tax=Colletotrichum tofieldiae TaxID=708197 RepID=A0A166W6D9_9PEZI|nr:GNAT family acetyltransferase [Colletotrichum tofieldiae]GKT63850.1 GNAT family acetyltransferase [Colletotrichum tofieldiae]GKT72149.1 GNAT family acetyltransferase [Colletotrichum tofieldiae]GKT90043.1 GNAT family acetyltransferase [Colletotrichum tofieldiae]